MINYRIRSTNLQTMEHADVFVKGWAFMLWKLFRILLAARRTYGERHPVEIDEHNPDDQSTVFFWNVNGRKVKLLQVKVDVASEN